MPEHQTKTRKKDLEILSAFIHLYCQGNHSPPTKKLCPECEDLFQYASERLANCPFDPKPRCSACKVQCYQKEEQAKIREVMRYSGWRIVMRGRVDYLWHHFVGSNTSPVSVARQKEKR